MAAAAVFDPRPKMSAEERRLVADDNRFPAYGATPYPPALQGFSGGGNNPHQINGPGQGVVVVAVPYLQEKSLCEAYLLCLPFGFLGIHHFYLRRPWFGLLYFLTGGLLGVGWLADIVRLPWLVREANEKMRRPPDADPPQVNLIDAYLLWFPLGIIGLHHYYLRRPVWGIVYTLSGGIFCIGWIVDAFRLPSLVRGTNDRLLQEHLQKDPAPAPAPAPFRVSLCNAYLLCMVPPLGILGAHHFYLRRYVMGTFYLCTGGGFGIGWVVDWFRLKWLTERTNHPERFPLGHRQKFVDDACVYAFPLGFLGTHHFYLERPVWGLLYFVTGGLFGIGWLVDLCRMSCLTDDANRRIGLELAIRAAARSNLIIASQGTPAYTGGQTGYNSYGTASTLYPPPPPYQPFVGQPPSGDSSWVSVASQPLPPPPHPGGGHFAARPPDYTKCVVDNGGGYNDA